MDALYVEHDGKIGVLSSDEYKVVSQVIGTDLTLVYYPPMDDRGLPPKK